MFLIYSKTRRSNCVLINPELLEAYCVEDNSFFSGMVRVKIALPELTIVDVEGLINSGPAAECSSISDKHLSFNVGEKLGPGMSKRFSHLFQIHNKCWNLRQLFMECCFTAVGEGGYWLREKVQSGELEPDLFHKTFLSEEGSRYKNTCVVFSENGSFLKRIGVKIDGEFKDALYKLEHSSMDAKARVGRTTFCSVEVDNNDEEFIVYCAMDDMGQGISTEIRVNFNTLEITDTIVNIRRVIHPECKDMEKQLKEIVGFKIESGIRKKLQAALTGPKGCIRLANMIINSVECVGHALLSRNLLLEKKAGNEVVYMGSLLPAWLSQYPAAKERCQILKGK